MSRFSENLKNIRLKKGMTQSELADILNISSSTIGMYEQGRREPDFETLEAIADTFNVSMARLLGDDAASMLSSHPDILPIKIKKIPLLGEIACGELKYAEEDFEGYVECGAEVHADFALRAKGDSMVNARILDGDIVFIRKQPIVENGEIAAVLVEDETTLKRYNRYGDVIVLKAENPSFEDIVVKVGEEKNIRILGKAIAFQSNIM